MSWVYELKFTCTAPLAYGSTPMPCSCLTVRVSMLGVSHQQTVAGDEKYSSARQAARAAAVSTAVSAKSRLGSLSSSRWLSW